MLQKCRMLVPLLDVVLFVVDIVTLFGEEKKRGDYLIPKVVALSKFEMYSRSIHSRAGVTLRKNDRKACVAEFLPVDNWLRLYFVIFGTFFS